MAAPPIGPALRIRHRRRRSLPMSEINVTPFVDVMLVLLIVFMVSAPLLTAGVPVDLPETQAKPLNLEKEPITLTVDADGHIFLKEQEIAFDELVPKLTDLSGNNLDERIYVRGDKAASYGTVMRVMGSLNGAGFRRIGLVALTEADSSSK
jgi:biopolymer transport protein TolR